MAKTWRVAQWATGVMGRAALRGVLRHPRLELAAATVYGADEEGRDAGALLGEADASTTGFHLVHAVAPACEASEPEPGIKTHLDLPLITGSMSTHEGAR